MYSKMLTCHPARYNVDDANGLEAGEDYETVFDKWFLLTKYNFIIVVTVTGLLYMYTESPLGSSIKNDILLWVAIISAALIMNLSLRVASLSDLKLETDFYDNMVDRSIGFGYGFIVTTYFMTFFGLSTYVIQSGLGFDINSISISNRVAIIFTLMLFIGPAISSAVSMLLLHPWIFGVKEHDSM